MRNLKKMNEGVAMLEQADRQIRQALQTLPSTFSRGNFAMDLNSVRAGLCSQIEKIKAEIKAKNLESVLGRKLK